MNLEDRNRVDQIKNQAKRFIWITFQKVGFHKYPAAESDPLLADVQYLGNKHRHLFKFRIAIEIFHNDREIEFHQFLNFCESLFSESRIDIDFKSVEMLSDELYVKIAEKYSSRDIKIEVSEDGECGCLIEYNTSKPLQSINI